MARLWNRRQYVGTCSPFANRTCRGLPQPKGKRGRKKTEGHHERGCNQSPRQPRKKKNEKQKQNLELVPRQKLKVKISRMKSGRFSRANFTRNEEKKKDCFQRNQELMKKRGRQFQNYDGETICVLFLINTKDFISNVARKVITMRIDLARMMSVVVYNK